MSSSVPGGTTTRIVTDETRVFNSPLTVSGTLEVQGNATVTDVTDEIFGKSRADGEKQLIVRAEGKID